MTEWDKMYIKIYNIKNADVYLAKGKGYIWLDHLDQMVVEGDVFDTEADWQFYVVGVATKIFKGTFTMKVWVEQNDEPEDKTEIEPANVTDPGDEEEEENDDSTDEGDDDTTDTTDDNEDEDTDAEEDDDEEEAPAIIAVISQTVSIDANLDDWVFNGGEDLFVTNMADKLGIDEANIIIQDIRSGSVIIDFDLIVDENSYLSAEDLE